MAPHHTFELSAPALLLAMPQLAHGPFGHAVVLLARHDADGSMGLAINKPSGVSLQTFAQGLQVHFEGHAHDQVFVGGPVEEERAFILHSGAHRGPETRTLLPGVALSFSMESLSALAQTPPEHLRVCVGYAGWGPGQLAQEIGLGAWLVMPASALWLFETPPEHMWHNALRSMGIEPLQLMQRPTASN